jgi:hypothetical protein
MPTESDYIRSAIYDIVDKYAKKIVNEVMNEYSKFNNINGNANSDYILNIARNEIALQIFSSGQKAWILEYGKGSRMDTDTNPYLQEYWYSEFRNPLRYTTTIVGRPEGYYQDLDGETHYSHGGMVRKGKALPVERKTMPDSPFYAQPAMHVLRELIVGPNGYLNDILDELLDILIQYPYEKLFPDKIYL